MKIAQGRKLPCFDLEKLLLNFSRDTEPDEHKRVKSTWLYFDHEPTPESAPQPHMQGKKFHQERQRWKYTESPQPVWTVIRMPQVWGLGKGRVVSEATRSRESLDLFSFSAFHGAVYCLAILIICGSSQSPSLSLGIGVLIRNMKRLEQVTSKFP